MIEGPAAVVIFDGQLLLLYADDVALYMQTLGKPVDQIILSHAHTDHWSGLQVLTERFPDAGVFALDGVADELRARDPARLDSLRHIYGDKISTKVTVPTETITEGVQRIDGITYDFKRFVDAEIGFAARRSAARAKSVDGIRPDVFTEPTRIHCCGSFRSLDDRSGVAQDTSRPRHDHHRA
jgi:metal-dependent hydrolase (beta-lactamase superfamily II)